MAAGRNNRRFIKVMKDADRTDRLVVEVWEVIFGRDRKVDTQRCKTSDLPRLLNRLQGSWRVGHDDVQDLREEANPE